MADYTAVYRIVKVTGGRSYPVDEYKTCHPTAHGARTEASAYALMTAMEHAEKLQVPFSVIADGGLFFTNNGTRVMYLAEFARTEGAN